MRKQHLTKNHASRKLSRRDDWSNQGFQLKGKGGMWDTWSLLSIRNQVWYMFKWWAWALQCDRIPPKIMCSAEKSPCSGTSPWELLACETQRNCAKKREKRSMHLNCRAWITVQSQLPNSTDTRNYICQLLIDEVRKLESSKDLPFKWQIIY